MPYPDNMRQVFKVHSVCERWMNAVVPDASHFASLSLLVYAGIL